MTGQINCKWVVKLGLHSCGAQHHFFITDALAERVGVERSYWGGEWPDSCRDRMDVSSCCWRCWVALHRSVGGVYAQGGAGPASHSEAPWAHFSGRGIGVGRLAKGCRYCPGDVSTPLAALLERV